MILILSHQAAVQDPWYTPYNRLPVWVATEALSFGTLSQLIAASGESQVLNGISASTKVSRRILPGQIRSFVYLRNRAAHCAKLWNHGVLEKPGLQPNTTRRAKEAYGAFDDHSVFKILVALDDLATKSDLRTAWLEREVMPILDANPLLRRGITQPRKYEDFTP